MKEMHMPCWFDGVLLRVQHWTNVSSFQGCISGGSLPTGSCHLEGLLSESLMVPVLVQV